MDSQKIKIRDKAISSGGWGLLNKSSGVVVQFFIGIVLARLLPPEDFGLIGMGMIIIGLGEVFVNLGLGPSLIQRNEISKKHIRLVFTVSLVSGFLLSFLVYFTAPISKLIFESEAVVPIVEALSILFLLGGFQITSQSLLKKRLDFKNIFIVNITKNIFYGTSTVLLAFMGFGVWSLVIGSILQKGISLVLSYFYVRHSLKPFFSKREFYDLFRFGSGMTLNGIFNYFALQGDFLIIGRVLGSYSLGLYTKAYTLMQQPTSQFVNIISDVLFPTVSLIQNDIVRVRKLFLKSMRVISFITVPLCLYIILVSEELVISLYGENWVDAIVPVQILGGFGIFRALYSSGGSFLRARGWVYRLLGANIAYGFFMIFGVWVGATYFGLVGATWAAGISIFFIWLIIMDLNCRSLSLRRSAVINSFLPSLLLGIVIFVFIYALKMFLGIYILNKIYLLAIISIIYPIFILFLIFIIPQKLFSHIPFELIILFEKYIPKNYNIRYHKILNLLSNKNE